VIGRIGAATDTGRKRRRNEDSYFVEPPLFAIADGMGGAQAGEVASRLAAGALGEDAPGDLPSEERVVALIQEANRRIYDRSSSDPTTSGMGTTITVALVDDGEVTVGHVGDSRAYLIRDGRIEQVTEDHSLVAELVRNGKLSPADAETHPQRSVITRALGTDPDVDVDTFVVDARVGDVFVLCSDGLTDMIDEETMLAVVERHRDDLDRAAKALVAAANKGGGEDNITVVAFEIAEVAPDDATAETVRMPAARNEPEPSDEDTLDETDRVPTVDTMVVPPEQAERIFERQRAEAVEVEEDRERRRWPLLLLLLVVAIVAAYVVWRLVT
jgi:protein phosphatase